MNLGSYGVIMIRDPSDDISDPTNQQPNSGL